MIGGTNVGWDQTGMQAPVHQYFGGSWGQVYCKHTYLLRLMN